MALAINTKRAFRTHDELEQLVHAVMAGTEHDETFWLEMKSVLDLFSKGGHFAIARAILGFANRSPVTAALAAEGTAYVIVGADHAGCHGVTPVDITVLEQGLGPYLETGDGTPRWAPRYLDFSGKAVLVVTVEAPRWGDRINTLRKAFEKSLAGTIFVRAQAKTEIAGPSEIAMLEDRYLRGSRAPGMELVVSATYGGRPLAVLSDYRDDAVCAEWIDTQRAKLLENIPVDDVEKSQDAVRWGWSAVGLPPGQRETYLNQVEKYLVDCRTVLPTVALGNLVRSDLNKVVVRAENEEDSTLESVRLVIEVNAAEAQVFDLPPTERNLPDRPTWEGARSSLVSGISVPRLTPSLPDISAMRPRYRGPGAVDIIREGNIFRATFTFGDLHPAQREDGEALTLVPMPGVSEVRFQWTASAKNRIGAKTGTISLPVEAKEILALDG